MELVIVLNINLISKNSGITDSISHNLARIRIDVYSS